MADYQVCYKSILKQIISGYGVIGSHRRLKISRAKARVGSNPTTRTNRKKWRNRKGV